MPKMNAQHTRARIAQSRVIAILRGDYRGWFDRIARALAEGGVTAMEVTMNSPGALEGIAAMRQALGDAFLVGAGTVLTMDQLLAALEAGAQFIVAPNTHPDIVRGCVVRDVCVIPGAYTATEIVNAFALGATMVKLFPADLSYFKAIRAPLDHIPFCVTGGVSADNAADFIRAGAEAVGMGSHLVGDYVKSEAGLETLRTRAAQLTARLQAA